MSPLWVIKSISIPSKDQPLNTSPLIALPFLSHIHSASHTHTYLCHLIHHLTHHLQLSSLSVMPILKTHPYSLLSHVTQQSSISPCSSAQMTSESQQHNHTPNSSCSPSHSNAILTDNVQQTPSRLSSASLQPRTHYPYESDSDLEDDAQTDDELSILIRNTIAGTI